MHLNDRVLIIKLLIISFFFITMIQCDSELLKQFNGSLFGSSNEIVGAQILVAPLNCRPGRIYWRGVCRKIML